MNDRYWIYHCINIAREAGSIDAAFDAVGEIETLKAERDALLEALGDLLTFEPEHCPCGERECEESQRAWGAARAAIDAARSEK